MYKEYWEKYYKSNKALSEPSLFAKFVLKNYIKENDFLIELGCGNGRDGFYFAHYGISIIAIDQCESEIYILNKKNNISNLKFICKDFSKFDIMRPVNHIYSRFSLHSISEKEEDKVIKWAYKKLQKNGYLLVEARGKKNELFKLGIPVQGETNAYIYNGHYRRFIDIKKFCNKLKSIGFIIRLAKEQSGFAPFGNTNYKFIRVIASK